MLLIRTAAVRKMHDPTSEHIPSRSPGTTCQRGFSHVLTSPMWQPNMFSLHLGSRPSHTHTLKHTQKRHTALLQIVLTHIQSTTKTNTCKRVTLRGCNLQENPIWQSSCQCGSQIDCSRGAHRVASCPSTLLYQLDTHTHIHTQRDPFGDKLKVGSGSTTVMINSCHLF